jgi:late competence development protein ComFB
MAMNTLQSVVRCLEEGYGEIQVEEPVRSRALGHIDRMLDFVRAPPARDRQVGAGLRAEHRRGLSAQPLGLPAGQVPAGAIDIAGMRIPNTSAMNVDFSSVHNHYKRPVFEAVLQRASDYPYLDAEALPDVACVALNRMGSRYIRHAVDLTLNMTAKQRTAM